jgi:hypothetical protein
MPFPKQSEIELALLQEIEAMGGQAKPSEDFLRKVAAHFPQITKADLEEKMKDGTNRWYNWVAWVRMRLVREGELYREPRGIWRITGKGRERLRKEGLLKVVSPLLDEPDKLAEQARGLIEKLVELAKKGEEKTPPLTHDEVVQKVKEMGNILGKSTEPVLGVPYKHDCVWKDNLYASPKLVIVVIEVCDKGNLDKDIASLDWAVASWGAKGILVIFDAADLQSAQKKLAQKSQIYPLKAEDLVKLHSVFQAGDAQAIRSIFAI